MNIIKCHTVNLCGLGFQTESLIQYCKKNEIKVNCIAVECYTQKPEQCYRIPSKRFSERNSFSEVDMYSDAVIDGIPVKRIDALLSSDYEYPFIVLDENECHRIHQRLLETSASFLFLSEEQLRIINNTAYEPSEILASLWSTNQYMFSEIQRLKNCLRRQLVPTIFDFHFEFHLVEHCNLKCRGCTHFSPLAEKEFLSIEEFEKDISRLSALTDKNARFINLLGGEPLLHPEIAKFPVIARKYFPNSIIRIVSNGILIPKMDDDFWKSCRENDIILGITQYPINVNYKSIIQTISDNFVRFESFSGDDITRDEMWKLSLSKTQLSRPIDNFMRCPRANACVFLSHGKLFNCATMANIHHFNKFFNQEYILDPQDYKDIHKVNDVQELLDFLCKPKSFCRYCNIDQREYGSKWTPSKLIIEEWT